MHSLVNVRIISLLTLNPSLDLILWETVETDLMSSRFLIDLIDRVHLDDGAERGMHVG